MNKRTKALEIPASVRYNVWKRDNMCCVLCGCTNASPNAHYISRSHGGLGIEQNVVTLCQSCHHRYDNTVDRPLFKSNIAKYLNDYYENWDESQLIYKKWSDIS